MRTRGSNPHSTTNKSGAVATSVNKLDSSKLFHLESICASELKLLDHCTIPLIGWFGQCLVERNYLPDIISAILQKFQVFQRKALHSVSISVIAVNDQGNNRPAFQ